MKSNEKVFVKKARHSRGMLSRIFRIPSCCSDSIKADILWYNNENVGDSRRKPSGMRANLTGFTLIELLVVVLIIGILAAVAVPQYQVAVGKTRLMRVLPIMRSILGAQDIYYLTNNTYASKLTDLDIDLPEGAIYEEGTSTWGNYTLYENISDGMLALYSEKRALTWEIPDEVVIDINGEDMFCYSKDVNSMWEKVCKTMGEYAKRSGGHNYYRLK